jgi:hypothetical protein
VCEEPRSVENTLTSPILQRLEQRLQQTTAAVEHQAEPTTTTAAEGQALAAPLAAYEVGQDDDCDAIPLVRSIWHSKSGYKSVTFNSNHRAAKKPWQAKDD